MRPPFTQQKLSEVLRIDSYCKSCWLIVIFGECQLIA